MGEILDLPLQVIDFAVKFTITWPVNGILSLGNSLPSGGSGWESQGWVALGSSWSKFSHVHVVFSKNTQKVWIPVLCVTPTDKWALTGGSPSTGGSLSGGLCLAGLCLGRSLSEGESRVWRSVSVHRGTPSSCEQNDKRL